MSANAPAAATGAAHGTAFDVVIAGGGPAGLSVAETIARAGLRTLVVERNAALGIPLRTSGGSWIASMQALGVPASFYQPIHRIRIVGPREEAVFDYTQPECCVLDVRRLYQWLGERAIAAGAQIRLKARADGPLQEAGRVVGLRVQPAGSGAYDLRAALVVDATGYPMTLAKGAQRHRGFDTFGVGAEYDLYAPAHDPGEAVLLVGSTYAPNGYAWALPYGNGRVRLGVGVGRPQSRADPAQFLDGIADRAPALGALRGASPIEAHVGLIPFAAPRSVPFAADGLVVVGDAAAQSSALIGEGIRYVMQSGRFAGDAIAAYFARGRDAEALAGYERAWRAAFGRDLRIAYEGYQRIVEFGDTDWDREVGRFRQLTPAQFAQGLRCEFTVAWALAVGRRYAGSMMPWKRALKAILADG